MGNLTPQERSFSVKILGGNGGVGEGNSHLLEFGRSFLLLDIGSVVTNAGVKPLSAISRFAGQAGKVVVTHSHLDHFGSLPELLRARSAPTSILSSRWTRIFVQNFLQQNGFSDLARWAHFTEAREPTFDTSAEHAGWYEWGPQNSGVAVGLFEWPHSTPEARGLTVVHIPNLGSFVWLVDLADPDTTEQEKHLTSVLKQIAALPGGVVACFVDSTAAGRKNHRPSSEAKVRETIGETISACEKVAYLTCFSSDVGRIAMAAKVAAENDREVALIAGQSLRTSIGLACTNLDENGQPYINGEASFNSSQNRWYVHSIEGLPVVSLEEAIHWANNDPSKLIVFAAGTQAEGWEEADQAMDYVGDLGKDVVIASAMTRLIKYGLRPYQSLKSLKIHAGDTVIFSASEIPGNVDEITMLKAEIVKQGGIVIDDSIATVHLSGHGSEVVEYLRFLNPQYVIPIHGDHGKRELLGKSAQQVVPFTEVLLVDDLQEVNFAQGKYDQVLAQIQDIPELEPARSTLKFEPVPIEGSLTVSIQIIEETGQFLDFDFWTRNFTFPDGAQELAEELVKSHVDALLEAGGKIESNSQANRFLGRIAHSLIVFFRGTMPEERPYVNVVLTKISLSNFKRVSSGSFVRV